MRKFLLATALVVGLVAPAMAVTLDDITFGDLSSGQRTAYFKLMAAPCSATMDIFLHGPAESRSGITAAIVVRWRLLTMIPMTNDDGTLLGAACGSHPDYTIAEMVAKAVELRRNQ